MDRKIKQVALTTAALMKQDEDCGTPEICWFIDTILDRSTATHSEELDILYNVLCDSMIRIMIETGAGLYPSNTGADESAYIQELRKAEHPEDIMEAFIDICMTGVQDAMEQKFKHIMKQADKQDYDLVGRFNEKRIAALGMLDNETVGK